MRDWGHGSGIEGTPLGQEQPALDDAVDQPDAGGQQNEIADGENKGQTAGRQPPQGDPEGADLPAEMRVEPGAADIVALDQVDQQAADQGEAEQEAGRLQGIDDRRYPDQILRIGGRRGRGSGGLLRFHTRLLQKRGDGITIARPGKKGKGKSVSRLPGVNETPVVFPAPLR